MPSENPRVVWIERGMVFGIWSQGFCADQLLKKRKTKKQLGPRIHYSLCTVQNMGSLWWETVDQSKILGTLIFTFKNY